jgi:predicted ATPase/DNA-binding SARP family transcriptional activator
VTPLHVHLLGPLRVTSEAGTLVLASRRQRALMAALALGAGRSVSVADLVDALWGEEPPAGARTTLQTYVSRLRGVVGEEAVLHAPGGYRLAPFVTTDAAAATRLAEEARSCTGDPLHALDLATRALALWDGRSLADLAEEEWFVPAAAGLDQLRANLGDLAAAALITAGRPTEAAELLDVAARADPLREPTQVLLVRALHEAGRNAEALRAADRYRRRLGEETGLVPGPALAEEERRALAGPDEPAPSPPPSLGGVPSAIGVAPVAGLPAPTRMVGRDDELSRLLAALQAARLVTVVGPGGMGKTRLAAELVLQRPRAGRIVVVELAPVEAGDVLAAVAASLGARGDRVDEVTVAEILQGEEALLVLDNAEHVMEPVGSLVRVLLDRCPRVRVLVTSRSRLELPHEHVVPLGPLALRGDRPASVELLAERVQRAGGPQLVTDDDPRARELCRRLEGLPLAIELAAGRVAVLGLDGLLQRLDEVLDLLDRGGPDGGRHASLRTVVEWSYRLLEPPAQRLLAVLAAFDGEFDLDAAEHVGSAVLAQPASLLLGRLVETSLVATTGVPGRYRLLDMIRRFGRERLAADGLEDRARSAHTAWVAERLEAVDRSSVGADESTTVAALDAVRNEVRSALRAAHATEDAAVVRSLVVPLAGPMLYRPDGELIIEAGHLIRPFLERVEPGRFDPRHAAVAAAGARLAVVSGVLEHVDVLADLAERYAGADRDGQATCLRAAHARGVLRLYQGRPREAEALFAAVAGHPAASAVDRLDVLGGLGLACCYDGRPGDAAVVAAEHRALADTLGSHTYRAFAEYVAGEVQLARGDTSGAAQLLRTAADRAWAVGASFVWGIAATVLAAVLVRHGDAAEARSHLLILLTRWRRTATWPQLWTTLRLAAELLATQRVDDVALLVLAAADLDAAAPELVGDDLQRCLVLRADLRTRLGDGAAAGITAGAATLRRVAVVERAMASLDQLALG